MAAASVSLQLRVASQQLHEELGAARWLCLCAQLQNRYSRRVLHGLLSCRWNRRRRRRLCRPVAAWIHQFSQLYRLCRRRIAGPALLSQYQHRTSPSTGLSNNNFGGPGYTVPPITAPGAISQTLNVGNYVNSSGAFVQAGGAPGFPDPYLSGRAPEFNFWNFGVQRALAKDIVATVNYAGSSSHFIAGASNIRGLQSGQINPAWYAMARYGKANGMGNLLLDAATPANLANANTAAAAVGLPAINLPYAGFGQAAATSKGAGQATIARALTWMPQFSSTADTWGNVANVSYNSMQLSIAKRMSHGLTLNLNYTYSKQLDDTGTQRSGFAIPADELLSGKGAAANHIDRSWSSNSVPQALAIYGVYHIPVGGESALLRAVAGGWTLSGLDTYYSGTPLAITSSACTSSLFPNTGQCMPDLDPAFNAKSIRQNGHWGKGITALTLVCAHRPNQPRYLLHQRHPL